MCYQWRQATEQDIDGNTLSSFNTEAMKLAAMGVTVTVSSGDDGVSTIDGTCQCNANSGSAAISHANYVPSFTWTGSGYFPSFPATCPYVTALGATMGPNTGGPEIVCQSNLNGVITSGGGFR